ncbi:MAG: hypothetical protein J3K34DRAFT_459159 [Monoraphidium minutum]|nr:MAG: hypothetical protein J3K34DRAFT_459159 [Monoraphidium minutum]
MQLGTMRCARPHAASALRARPQPLGRPAALAPLRAPWPRAAPHAPRRGTGLQARAAGEPGQPGTDVGDVDALMAKYGLSNGATPGGGAASGKPALRPGGAPKQQPAAQPAAAPPGNGVFLLLVINIVAFAADHLLGVRGMQGLYLNHAHPQWWQWVTHAFCHASWGHLSMNLFNLCVFGKLVEETEGAFGLVFTYIACALGAAGLSVLLQPAVVRGAVTVSLGASGAIFGLFMVSVLARISWDPRRLLEGLILGWFVVRQVIQEVQAQAAGGLVVGGLQVGHLAHLGGALAGVLLVLALKAVPDPGETK